MAKNEYELVSIDNNDFCTILTETGEYREDLKLPNEADFDFVKPLREAYEAGTPILVSVMSALGQEHIVSFREDKK